MRVADIELGERSYQVMIGFNILDDLGAKIRHRIPKAKSVLLVSDAAVSSLFGDRCLRSLADAGFKARLAVVPPGEQSKALDVASGLYDEALEAGLDRRSPIVALGGGVVGDLAGFVAATYLRGVPFIQVPTTLLAQVDSSVGGKVAVNHPHGKNLIGSFYQPSIVLADLSLLKTLEERQFMSGLAEIVKVAAVWDGSFFFWLAENFDSLCSALKQEKEKEALAEAVFRAVTIKGEVVARDERESGLRRILNFGHTFGHALEAATGFNHYLHGEAVLVGMKMACSAALKIGCLQKTDFDILHRLLDRFAAYPPPEAVTVEKVIDSMAYDKKREGEKHIFILPEAPGKVIVRSLPENIIRETICEYLNAPGDRAI